MFFWISSTAKFISIASLIIIGLLAGFRQQLNLKRKLYALLVIFGTSSIITLVLKRIVLRLRPSIVHHDIIELSKPGLYSFPSGHTTVAFALSFGMLFLGFKKSIIFPFFVWAFLTAYSRMVLGAHYPLDVLTAIIISLTVSLFIAFFFRKWNQKTN
ncbi:phosphatase PAP2 family protein [Zunongwangia sp. H14]|uniref:phosphatase PAP2 family protein n=1 Tax=Zunongwangia sp. H14 TaxID=3240792 RepID=UPI003568C647